jgi:hypothetical protein
MALEDLTGGAKFIDALVAGNPVSNDDRREGDDHIRGLKNVLHNTFPNIAAAVTATAAQLNGAGSGAFPGAVSVGGNLTVAGTLGVTGGATFGGDVTGSNFYVGAATGANGKFGVGGGFGPTITAWGTTAPGAGRLDFVTAGGAMIFGADGALGIGIAPTSPLHVKTATATAMLQVENNAFAFSLQASGQEGFLNMPGTGRLVFRNGAGFTERMVIDAAGKVGIGAAPSNKLTVTFADPVLDGVGILNTNNGAALSMLVSGSTGAVPSWVNGTVIESTTAPGGLTLSSYQQHMVFQTGARAERMRIDAAGKITQKDGLTLGCDPGPTSAGIPIGGIIGGQASGPGVATLKALDALVLGGGNQIVQTGYGGSLAALVTGTYRLITLTGGTNAVFMRIA